MFDSVNQKMDKTPFRVLDCIDDKQERNLLWLFIKASSRICFFTAFYYSLTCDQKKNSFSFIPISDLNGFGGIEVKCKTHLNICSATTSPFLIKLLIKSLWRKVLYCWTQSAFRKSNICGSHLIVHTSFQTKPRRNRYVFAVFKLEHKGVFNVEKHFS